MSAILEVIRFQTDRGLHLKPYDALNEHTNLFEEILESIGLDVPKENRGALQDQIALFSTVVTDLGVANRVCDIQDLSNADKVDAYCDMIVFAIGAIMKLGYHPELALAETAKEINSREGKMVNGKFEKDLSDEAKAKWYKADYDSHAIIK